MGSCSTPAGAPGPADADRRRVVGQGLRRAGGASLPRGYSRCRAAIPTTSRKSCTDLIAQSYAWSYDLPVVVTRCGNLYGGGDLNFNRLIPGSIRDALAEEGGRRCASDGTPPARLPVRRGRGRCLPVARPAGPTRPRSAGRPGTSRPRRRWTRSPRRATCAAGVRAGGSRAGHPRYRHAEILAQHLSSEKARRLLAGRPPSASTAASSAPSPGTPSTSALVCRPCRVTTRT